MSRQSFGLTFVTLRVSAHQCLFKGPWLTTATNDKQQEIGREGLYFLDSSFFSFNFLACRRRPQTQSLLKIGTH